MSADAIPLDDAPWLERDTDCRVTHFLYNVAVPSRRSYADPYQTETIITKPQEWDPSGEQSDFCIEIGIRWGVSKSAVLAELERAWDRIHEVTNGWDDDSPLCPEDPETLLEWLQSG